MNRSVSAYLPCYNNQATILDAIKSIQNQTLPVSELFVVDDGSSDNSVSIVEAAGVKVIRNSVNEGRGAVRAKAMLHATNEFVLSCDAGIALPPQFVHDCLSWLASDKTDQNKIAAVHGRIVQAGAKTVSERWRGRHLLKIDANHSLSRQSLFVTTGAIVRKSIILSLGNYDSKLRYGEDKELGQRLLSAGYDVIFDPKIEITAISENNVWQVLERYSRWHAAVDTRASWQEYLK